MSNADPVQDPTRDALQKCAEAFVAINDWLGQATTRQYATDAIWRAEKALNAAGVPVPMRSGEGHWRGSVFRALERCGLGWTGYEDEIRFRLMAQHPSNTAAGPSLHEFLQAAFDLLQYARGEVLEKPGNLYWLEKTVNLMMGARAGMVELPKVCPRCGNGAER